MVLYRYDISVSPAATGRKLKQINRQLLDSPELADANHDIVSDFKSTLVSRKKLDKDDTLINVLYQNENHDEPRDDAPTYTVRVLYTNTLPIGDLINHLKPAGPPSFLDKQSTIQALNIFLNHHAKTDPKLTTIGSSRAFPLAQESESFPLGVGLIAIRGFFASVRAATSRILVNVNVSHGVFYQHGPLDGLIREYMERNKSIPALASFVKRLRVNMTHVKKKRNMKGEKVARAKTILGLATQNDGNGMEHPPRIQAFGAGPQGVLFWMDPAGYTGSSGGVGKKARGQGGKSPPSNCAGKYISVYDYFKQSKFPFPSPLTPQRCRHSQTLPQHTNVRRIRPFRSSTSARARDRLTFPPKSARYSRARTPIRS